mgnify:CR=1 FL=1
MNHHFLIFPDSEGRKGRGILENVGIGRAHAWKGRTCGHKIFDSIIFAPKGHNVIQGAEQTPAADVPPVTTSGSPENPASLIGISETGNVELGKVHAIALEKCLAVIAKLRA